MISVIVLIFVVLIGIILFIYQSSREKTAKENISELQSQIFLLNKQVKEKEAALVTSEQNKPEKNPTVLQDAGKKYDIDSFIYNDGYKFAGGSIIGDANQDYSLPHIYDLDLTVGGWISEGEAPVGGKTSFLNIAYAYRNGVKIPAEQLDLFLDNSTEYQDLPKDMEDKLRTASKDKPEEVIIKSVIFSLEGPYVSFIPAKQTFKDLIYDITKNHDDECGTNILRD